MSNMYEYFTLKMFLILHKTTLHLPHGAKVVTDYKIMNKFEYTNVINQHTFSWPCYNLEIKLPGFSKGPRKKP